MPRPVDIQVNQTGNALSGLQSLTGALTGLGTAAIAASAVAVTALAAIGVSAIKQGIEFNATLEQMKISFQTLARGELGPEASLEDINALGEEMLEWVKEISISTPFEAMDLAKNLRLLIGMGVPLEEAKDLIMDLGDATSAMGGNAAMFETIARAMAQISAKGKVSTEELMQLAEAGIPAFEILQEKLGVTREELDELLRGGLIPAQEGIDALSQGMEERFGGAMDEQSQSLNGMLSSLEDFKNFLLADITAPIFENLKPLLEEMMRIAQSPEFKYFAEQIGIKLAETFEAALPAFQEFVNEIFPIMETSLPYLIKAWDGLIALLKSPEFHVAMRIIAELLGAMIFLGARLADVIFNKSLPAIVQLFDIFYYYSGKFYEFISALPDKVYKLGSEIIQGLINGLKSKWEELKNLVEDIANSILNKIQNPLQIESPSKKTEWLGKMTARGFYEGMRKENEEYGNPNSFAPVINFNNPVVREENDIARIAKAVQFEITKQNNVYRGGYSSQTV